MNPKWFFALTFFFYTTGVWAAESRSPYAGQESRDIKALSTEEIKGYSSGEGMGFARAAELNHYPGPKHVLDLADRLQLSAEQLGRTQAIFKDMNSKAVSLGKQVLEKEWLLDSRFAEGNISDDELVQLVTEISALQGRLRTVHLQAHVATKLVLTADQLRHYDALRGYQQSGTHGQHKNH